MSAFIMIIFYVFVIFQFIWYFTCTEHKSIPLLIVILDILFSIIPGMNILAFFINLLFLLYLIDQDLITLKDNWFNRNFLSYHE